MNKKITDKSGFLQRQVRIRTVDKDKCEITGTCPRCDGKVFASYEHIERTDKTCPNCGLLLFWV